MIGVGRPAPSPSPSVPNGLLGRWLLHPQETQRHWLHTIQDQLAAFAHAALPVVATIIAATMVLTVLVAVLRRARARRVAAGSRWVAIIPPELPDPAGGLACWRLLATLLSSRRTIGILRRPPVAVEFLADPAGLRVGLWVPATVSPVAVARALAIAWPGARATVTDPPVPVPAGASATGARMGPALGEWFPLGGTDGADPLRGVLAALAGCRGDETAVLQVLARPAPGRRIARARRAAWALRTGRPVSRLARALDLLQSHPTPAGPAAPDPMRLLDVRSITSKITGVPHFEVAVRYAACGGGTGMAGRRSRTGRRRELAAGFGLYTGPNHLVARRLPHPGRALAGRRLSGGFLASAGELAALAHLPADPAPLGMASGASARLVPPVEVPYG